MKTIIICLVIFFISFDILSAQKNNHNNCYTKLENYYPDEENPVIQVKVKIHIVQYSESEPRNLTINDTVFIKQQFEWINSFYRKLVRLRILYTKPVMLKIYRMLLIPFISIIKKLI